jgi:hypothetical protein
MRINGWSVNEDTGKVVLVSSLYNADSMVTVSKKDVEVAVQRAVRVFQAAKAAYHEDMESASDAYSMMQRLNEVSESTLDLQVIVLTNAVAVGPVEDIILPGSMPHIRWDVWDLVRLERAMAAGKSYETISIDFSTTPSGALPCLRMPDGRADFDAYLTIIPGELLFRIYEEHGSKLLELNVRSFLQARGKVNRGIRDTLKNEPERFLAYNNGISATAEQVTIRANDTGQLEIVSMSGFQVVNGGQTMASIHRARKEGQADLDSVFVQAKITVVASELIEELVPKISRFANTQNKINEPDFSSNDPFHVEIERLSEKLWCPGEQSRWFYERARGQYQVARLTKGSTPARRKKFDEATPQSQKIDKASLAKYMNSWDQLPHVVGRGSQNNFNHFIVELKNNHGNEWCPDENYYRNLVARAIIFKKAEKIAQQHSFPAYRANAIAYTVSMLSYKTFGRIVLDTIWKTQGVSAAIADTMYEWMPQILKEIEESSNGRNVTEWCKKEECWRTIQTMDIDIPGELQGELADGQPLPTVGSKKGKLGDGLTLEDRENLARTMRLTGVDWLNVHRWTLEQGMEKWVSGIAHTLCGYAVNDWQTIPSVKQARQAVKMLSEYPGELEK